MVNGQNFNLSGISFSVYNPVISFQQFSHVLSFKLSQHPATIWMYFQ